MKPLPKEFQFKCDEHSREQCEKLGIENPYGFELVGAEDTYFVVKNNLFTNGGYDESAFRGIDIISLADYIEEPTNISLGTKPTRPDHADLIVELTGKYVAAAYGSITAKLSANGRDAIINESLDLAEETVKQLKEKKYL